MSRIDEYLALTQSMGKGRPFHEYKAAVKAYKHGGRRSTRRNPDTIERDTNVRHVRSNPSSGRTLLLIAAAVVGYQYLKSHRPHGGGGDDGAGYGGYSGGDGGYGGYVSGGDPGATFGFGTGDTGGGNAGSVTGGADAGIGGGRPSAGTLYRAAQGGPISAYGRQAPYYGAYVPGSQYRGR